MADSKIKLRYRQMKDTIKIHIVDGCPEYIMHKLQTLYKVEINTENPDFIFYSVFGTEHLKYDCVRIFYTGENLRADFNFCDYAITFDYLIFEDRHLRYPLYLFYASFRDIAKREEINNNLSKTQESIQISDTHKLDTSAPHTMNAKARKYNLNQKLAKRKFCSFVVSNGKAHSIREEFFKSLSAYKKVDSGGKYKNNIGGTPIADKLAFLSEYKFNIAFENSSTNGYLTEKLFDAKAAHSIPIYWGDPTLKNAINSSPDNNIIWESYKNLEPQLNKKAFINISDFNSIQEAIDFIIFLDSNDSAYMDMLNEPLLLDTNYATYFDSKLEAFFAHIFSQPKQSAYRRGFGQWRLNIERRYKKAQKVRTIANNLIYPFKSSIKTISNLSKTLKAKFRFCFKS